jgi:hypothetical protein
MPIEIFFSQNSRLYNLYVISIEYMSKKSGTVKISCLINNQTLVTDDKKNLKNENETFKLIKENY